VLGGLALAIGPQRRVPYYVLLVTSVTLSTLSLAFLLL
jgi:energy-converting hydrogenase Eha subunit E